MSRVYNFSAGPSCLPEEVLAEAQAELLEYGDTGQSVMEMSHRSSEYEAIIGETERLVRALLRVPDSYRVLFLQGGASTQFAMVPLNLSVRGKAAYIDTGIWSSKAIAEASKYTQVNIVASSKSETYRYIPAVPLLADGYDYLHITLNNTIMGTAWQRLPERGNTPLVTDASSCILSEPLDVSRFALVYAGAQKNLAPAGVTLVIIRDDMLARESLSIAPTMLRYKTHADSGSLYNTPPCYAIYMMGKVLKWVERHGGAEGMKRRNSEKSTLFYDYLDRSDFFCGTAEKESRSLMNIPFITRETDAEKADRLNKAFVKEAKAMGLENLSGHRLVGGMRASLYNAMSIDGVKALIAFMDGFVKRNE